MENLERLMKRAGYATENPKALLRAFGLKPLLWAEGEGPRHLFGKEVWVGEAGRLLGFLEAFRLWRKRVEEETDPYVLHEWLGWVRERAEKGEEVPFEALYEEALALYRKRLEGLREEDNSDEALRRALAL